MKKSLLALAVLGAFAGAASAQSSVTLFGVVDLNLSYLDNAAGSQFTMGQDGIASSRLGFRGVEDLGGGMTASFWLEGALNPDTGTATGQTWQRRSTVSLAGGWGEVRLGRDYTATFWNSTIFDPFGTNGVGSAGNLAFVTPAQSSGGSYGTILRTNNMVGYFLPSGIAGGLYGQVQVAAGENTAGQKYWGGRLGYASGPFNIAGAYGKTQVSIVATPLIPGDQNGTQYNFGASWNFGFMQLSGYYGNIDIADASQDNWFIGLQAPMGVWTFKGSYGMMSRGGSNQAANAIGFGEQGAWQMALGATYDLSKRTALYANYSYLSNDSVTCGTVECGSALVVGSLQSGAGGAAFTNSNAGQSSKGFQLGVRHSF